MAKVLAATLLAACVLVGAGPAQAQNCEPPKVLIVLDKSSSMITGDDSNGVPKWDSATAAVETLVNDYGDRIDFGLMVFPYQSMCEAGQVVVDVGPGTAPAIVSFLRNPPPTSGNYTPMAQSLDVAGTYPPLLDPGSSNFALLVTDGWQYCGDNDPDTFLDPAIPVGYLRNHSVDTFVLGFGAGVDVLTLNEMAIAGGHELPNCNPNQDNPDAPDLCYHQTGNQTELEAALDDIAVEVTDEICDNLDNDCDGFTDNANPGSPDPLKETHQGPCGSCLSVCVNGQYQPCSTEGPCDDNDACTTNDYCSNDVCQGTPVSCDDGDPCTVDSCEPAQGCVHVTNNGACDDGNACTTDDQCTSNGCTGTPVLCDDGNVCTDDVCDPAGGCVFSSNNNWCEDLDACTINDRCSGGKCQGTPVDCGDGDVCTDDTCDPNLGCVSNFNQARCDDGDICTEDDTCANGVCVGTPFDCQNENICDHLDCDDGNVCTSDRCDENVGCLHDNNNAPCDDGDRCTERDMCSNGTCKGTPFDCETGDLCEGVTCDDGNPCTDDSCDPASGCVFKPNHNVCDDNDTCTYNDVCSNGQCSGTPIPCDDGNPCTEDSCDPGPCYGDACDPNGCVHTPVTGPCDDGDACTQNDMCSGGMCEGGSDVCGDSNMDPEDGENKAAGCGCHGVIGSGVQGTLSWIVLLAMMALAVRSRRP